MKFFDKKAKVGFATFFAMVLIILEFGILDGYMFTNTTENGLTLSLRTIERDLGYNFVVMSIVIFVLTLAYAAFIGYKKNWGGLIGLLLIAIAPFIGQVFLYDIFYGWGTAHLLPMLTLFGLDTAGRGVQLAIFAVILVLYVVLFVIFWQVRKRHDAKNPW